MLWRKDGHWDYYTFEFSESSDPILQRFSPVIDLWRDKFTDIPPQWSDFDFMDFEGWWGWLCIYDADPIDPLAFHVRLWGTKVTRVLGHDMTGNRMSPDLAAPTPDTRPITVCDLESNRDILDRSVIGIDIGPVNIEYGGSQTFSEVCLPLSVADGTLGSILTISQVDE